MKKKIEDMEISEKIRSEVEEDLSELNGIQEYLMSEPFGASNLSCYASGFTRLFSIDRDASDIISSLKEELSKRVESKEISKTDAIFYLNHVGRKIIDVYQIPVYKKLSCCFNHDEEVLRYSFNILMDTIRELSGKPPQTLTEKLRSIASQEFKTESFIPSFFESEIKRMNNIGQEQLREIYDAARLTYGRVEANKYLTSLLIEATEKISKEDMKYFITYVFFGI